MRRRNREFSGWVLGALLLFGMATGMPAAASESPPESAWEALKTRDPTSARQVTAEERRVLELLTVEQARAFADGSDPAAIILADGRLLAEALLSLGGFYLSWWSLDSGGGTATGGGFTLTGTLGQADAGELHGGGFALSGGFLSHLPQSIFRDGFESGDTSAWTTTIGGV